MGHFDQTARYAAKIDPPGFFHWLFGPAASLLTFREWLDTRRLALPGDPDRTGDLVAVFENRASVRGLRFTYEPEYLRFFQARFEPV